MDLTFISRAKSHINESKNYYNKAMNDLIQCLTDNVGFDKPLFFTEDIEFTIDTNENGGDYAYVQAIRVKDGSIQFVLENNNISDDSSWKDVCQYGFDMDELIDAIEEALQE